MVDQQAEPAAAGPQSSSLRFRRSGGGRFDRVADLWRRKRWFRWLGYLFAAFLLFIFLVWLVIARDLPSAEKLADYEPPLPTMVRDVDGAIVHSYARERRVQLDYTDFPKSLVNAYLAAEDKTFFSHGGLDYPGLARAAFEGVTSGDTPRGTSTITQQVAKNLLLTNEVTYTRKAKEAILAWRIEDALTKEQIISLYLNEIPLGRQSFGVQAAARAYFAKDVAQLGLHEMAFLAILPKAPEKYGRPQHEASAIERRNWVLGEMAKNEFITEAQAAAAQSQPLGLIERTAQAYPPGNGYFTEEVRRQLMERYGEKAEDGPYSVYAGGLWVRTSLDTKLQKNAKDALRGGLLRYHAGKGFKGPVATLKASDGDMMQQLASSNITIDYQNWRIGVVLRASETGGQIGFADGKTGGLTGIPSSVKTGDVIAVAPVGGTTWAVRTIPEASGGFVAQNPHNGRVYAMQGGFDSGLSSFNRATQAQRQPGSTIKPFVYSTALDQGMTPATKIVDGTFCVYQSAALGRKCFRNFGGSRGAGAQTMRWGLEQSRNLMTVRAANDAGMDKVVKTFTNVGIGDYKPYLAFALGAGDTTVLKMTNAYSILVNHGRQLTPTVIDYVQDRRGKVIWRSDTRRCKRCNMARWDGGLMPRFKENGKQVMDAMSAYQTVHMLEGVIQRGTATNLRDLDRPLFGKTGTSTGPTNAWFVGGGPDLIAGMYIGFDQPRPMGGYVQGGSTAAPMFKSFARASIDRFDHQPFRAPKGIRMVRIDRMSGRRVYGGWPGSDPKSSVIWEAFKPDTEPRRSLRNDEADAVAAAGQRGARQPRRASGNQPRRQQQAGPRAQQAPAAPRPDGNFAEEQGGIY